MGCIRHLFVLLPFLFAVRDADSAPLYPNSVVSNDLEFIRTSDQSVFSCLSYEGTRRAEMPDKRRDALFANGTFIYMARYKDGTSVELWAHPDFGSQSAAMASVEPVAQAIGKLPTLMRSKLDHVVIHEGDETAFAKTLAISLCSTPTISARASAIMIWKRQSFTSRFMRPWTANMRVRENGAERKRPMGVT